MAWRGPVPYGQCTVTCRLAMGSVVQGSLRRWMIGTRVMSESQLWSLMVDS